MRLTMVLADTVFAPTVFARGSARARRARFVVPAQHPASSTATRDRGSEQGKRREPRSTQRWRLLAVLVVATAGVLLAGCVSATSDEVPTLRVAHNPNSWGPLDLLTFEGSQTLEEMVYEPLVDYAEGGELKPALAESWEVSDDGRRVTFTLRQGVRFHDGTAFDADVVKWNFDRWVGKEKYSFFRTSELIDEVKVLDRYTVELVLSERYPPILRELTISRPGRFASPSSVGEDGQFVKAVGTGSWQVESFSETGATLVRFDGYWGEKPAIERVEFSVIPDPQTRLSALRTGEVDLIGGPYMAPIEPAEARELASADGVELWPSEPDGTFLLGLNTKGLLSQQGVRVAVAHALNRDELTEAIYAGFGQPAKRLYPPSIPHSGEPTARGFEPDAARAALEEAGWTTSGDGPRTRDGVTLELDLLIPSTPVGGVPDPRNTAAAIAANLEAVGIGVNIVAVDAAAELERKREGGYDLAYFRTQGKPYDPSGSVVTLLTSEESGSGNVYSTPEFDALVTAAVLADSDDAYQRLFNALEDAAVLIPVSHIPNLWATGPAVSGFKAPVTKHRLDLNGVTLSR